MEKWFSFSLNQISISFILKRKTYNVSQNLFLQVEDPSNSMGYTSAAFHPDGLILGTGTTGATVRIWDVKSRVYRNYVMRPELVFSDIFCRPFFKTTFSLFYYPTGKCCQLWWTHWGCNSHIFLGKWLLPCSKHLAKYAH